VNVVEINSLTYKDGKLVGYVYTGNGEPEAILPQPEEAKIILEHPGLQRMTQEDYNAWRQTL